MSANLDYFDVLWNSSYGSHGNKKLSFKIYFMGFLSVVGENFLEIIVMYI
jgi:hypothetical protein